MKILTLKIDENSKKGKALIDFLVASYSEEGDIQITAINGLPLTNGSESEIIGVAENSAKYKTTRKKKKEVKANPDTDESPYNPEFVKMVLEAANSTSRTVLNPNDIWVSLGLK